jgi:predicted transcriptional regulator
MTKARTKDHDALTRRQTQVMRALHVLGSGNVGDVQSQVEKDGVRLSYAAVKSALRGLVEADAVRADRRGRATIYTPRQSQQTLARSAAAHWIRTFFRGDSAAALVTFLDAAEADLDPAELERLRALLNSDRPQP